MAQCADCGSHIQDDESTIHYFVADLSPEIINILEQQKETTFTDLNEEICQTCFTDATETLTKDKNKHMKGRPKRWNAAAKQVQQQNVEPNTSSNHITCVWCDTSLNSTRSHAIPDGFQKQLLAKIIQPRKIPKHGMACFKCWASLTRKVTGPGEKTKGSVGARSRCPLDACLSCSRSLYNKRKKNLLVGPILDEIAASISPKEVPEGAIVCYTCWLKARRAVDRKSKKEASQEKPAIKQIEEKSKEKTDNEYISLSKYHRLMCDYSSCVAGCDRPAARAPLAVRCRLLASHNLYLPGPARLCNVHCHSDTVFKFQKDKLSNKFTGDHIADMLFLMKRHRPLDIDNIEAMDQHLRRIWLGVTWEQFLALTRANPAIPSRAVGIRLCQLTSSECPEILASLFQLSLQEIEDALRITKHLDLSKPDKLDHTKRMDHNKSLDKSDPVIPRKNVDAKAKATTTKVPLTDSCQKDLLDPTTLTPASAAMDVDTFLDQIMSD